MCHFVETTSVYKCGALERVEVKSQDCQRKECIHSKLHPKRCNNRSLCKKRSPGHSPNCQEYHELSYAFVDNSTEPCCAKICKRVQERDEGFIKSIDAIRREVESRMPGQESSDHESAASDGASMRQLRDVPM